MSDSEVSVVSSSEDLGRLGRICRDAGIMGFDTEFMREKTFYARVCFVQIAAPDHIWLIDPLAEIDLAPVAELFADPELETVVHAGRQDFEIFYERHGRAPSNVFDVQVAAGFVGLGASLPYGRLVAEVLGTTLRKGESYTDWCRRPLTEAQLTYAADDVRYLLELAAALKRRVAALGRTEWVREELRSTEEEESYLADPGSAWKKVSGRGSLSGRQTTVLKELARWREATAMRRDLPRGWVIKDPTLIDIARRQPSSVNELKAVRGMNAKEVQRSGREIIKAVELGRSAPPMETPDQPSRAVLARARVLSGLADAVVRARAEEADMATEVVATRAELEAVLAEAIAGRLRPERHKLFRGWRRELAGEAVSALVQGRIAVKVIDEPPYVKEVQV